MHGISAFQKCKNRTIPNSIKELREPKFNCVGFNIFIEFVTLANFKLLCNKIRILFLNHIFIQIVD